jgi:uncharacterized coiled-coil DUF342 family protein
MTKADVQTKLSASDSIKTTYQPARQELRTKFDEVNQKKNELNEERKAVFEKIKALQASMKRKVRHRWIWMSN